MDLRSSDFAGDDRKFEFILAPEYEELVAVFVESDTLGENTWVITLARKEDDGRISV